MGAKARETSRRYPRQVLAEGLPRGPKVVPFGGYLVGFYVCQMFFWFRACGLRV